MRTVEHFLFLTLFLWQTPLLCHDGTFRAIVTSSLQERDSLANLRSEEVAAAFLGFPVSSHATDFVTVKYMYAHWAMETARYLLAHIEQSTGPSFVRALSELHQVRVKLSNRQVKRLWQVYLTRESTDGFSEKAAEVFALILADFASSSARPQLQYLARRLNRPDLLLRAGPGVPLAIHPMDASGYGADGWLSDLRHTQYRVDADDTVHFKGLTLRPGDMVVLDHHCLHDGLNTCFSKPRSTNTHVATFVVLHRNGYKFPAIFEIHADGLRVVPLETYLSSDFMYWGQIVRPLEIIDSIALSKQVQTFLQEPFRYDFEAQEIISGEERRVNCGSQQSLILLQMGAERSRQMIPRCTFPPAVEETLRRFGMPFSHYLSPTDILRSRLLIQGTINNMDENLFWENFSRELIFGSSEGSPESLGDLLATHVLDPRAMPFPHAALEGVARFLYTNHFVADWIRGQMGFRLSTLPHASSPLLALLLEGNLLLELAGRSMVAVTQPPASLKPAARTWFQAIAGLGSDEVFRELRRDCQSELMRNSSPLDLVDVEQSPAFRRAKRLILTPVRRWFSK